MKFAQTMEAFYFKPRFTEQLGNECNKQKRVKTV